LNFEIRKNKYPRKEINLRFVHQSEGDNGRHSQSVDLTIEELYELGNLIYEGYIKDEKVS
jgi:hypothetical protein